MTRPRARTPDAQQPRTLVELRSQVEEYLSRLAFAQEASLAPLVEAMRHSLSQGGDRIRPVLALATADALGREPSSVLPLAAAIEMTHIHALVHDDLPGAAAGGRHRGTPTALGKLGEGLALLAGDALLAEAIALVLREQRDEPERVLSAVCELAQATGVSGLIGGQYIELIAPRDLDERGLHRLHVRKTGRLLAASVRSVVSLTGASGTAATALQRFASAIGVLFQVVGDARLRWSEHALGRRDGRPDDLTYPGRVGRKRTRQLAQDAHRTACEALAGAGRRTALLRQIADDLLARAESAEGQRGRAALPPAEREEI